MSILTDRKRAVGMGSAKSGTMHHWGMIVSSAMLISLVPLFIFTFGRILGAPYEEVVAYYSRPFPAIVAVLTILVSMVHFKNGVQAMIEDYVQGTARKVAIILSICLSYTIAGVGLFAIARIAL